MTFVYLVLAIIAEVIATSALKASMGFTRPIPSIVVVIGYGVAFYLLSLVLKTLPVGIAYAIWAGLGIVLVTLVGIAVFGERPDVPAVIGIGLIVAGVVMLQVFSKMNVH
ncbi:MULTISPECIES: DMT family transporter [Vreelandella]|jgi:small multidrug resistance pump|uniref:Multidrug efflux SMR transporter n=2 Tax=Vreelandella TaxID=3137766 RepID=A0A7C9NRA9_9GAMM|nr:MULTISPECIES: multidrug efflux SMR transporter [Halomonas]NDL71107.1 multidrug efflux SMR transporter [Halomonas alkaliphila]NYS46311.1 multidrug efflux SMR transporter [Halomonas zhaodongensis]